MSWEKFIGPAWVGCMRLGSVSWASRVEFFRNVAIPVGAPGVHLPVRERENMNVGVGWQLPGEQLVCSNSSNTRIRAPLPENVPSHWKFQHPDRLKNE